MTVTVNLTLSPAVIVTGVGACVLDALGQTPAGVPCRQCLLVPSGTIPWDGCDCDCATPGQVAQAITSVHEAETFPALMVGNWARCGPHQTVITVTLSVVRCVPVLDEQGVPPSCPDELAAAVTLENDRTAVRQALACCLHDLATAVPPTIRAYNIGPSVTVGESGGCAGIDTTYQISVGACHC